jgi:delta 1-pyrroline-5-carboxylate dehydrogenase
MEQQLSLLEVPATPGATPVWDALDEQERAAVVRRLAQLIAKTLASPEDNHE